METTRATIVAVLGLAFAMAHAAAAPPPKDVSALLAPVVQKRDVKQVLELHPYEPGKDYYLASFLVGAYQEILGDLHNLLGDTNAVHVTLENGHWSIDEVIEGDTVREVLQYVQFSADELMRTMRKRVEKALREQKMTVDESRVLLRFYESGLEGYTYLE